VGKKEMTQAEARGRIGGAASVIGIITNVFLFLGKFIVGTLVGSISMRADGINNLSDAGSSVISLISFKISSKPADRKHPFGHARIEYVASMIVSFLVLHIGIDLIVESVDKIANPTVTEFSIVSIIVLGASVLLKLALALFNGRLGKKIDSDVMKATAADSLSDAIATSAVLASMIITKFTSFETDAYMGLIVAAIIIAAGVKILLETKDHILGKAPDGEIIDSVKEIIERYPEAIGIHDMRLHNYGPGRTVASFHVEVDGAADVFLIHDAIDNMEKQISEELSIECTIHMDPIVTDDERVNELREKAREKVREIDERLNIHDFRFVEGHTHTNLIFDVVAPFELKMSDDEIVLLVGSKIKELSGEYFTVVTVDRE
jgi:cation diffusion facilitator family transporter